MRVLVPCTLAAALILSVPGAPAAESMHNHLVRAEPGIDSTVDRSPDRVELWFSEQPDLAITTVRLRPTRDSTRLISLGKVKEGTDLRAVAAALQGPIPPGSYTVVYRTAGTDGHVVKGSYRFTVAK